MAKTKAREDDRAALEDRSGPATACRVVKITKNRTAVARSQHAPPVGAPLSQLCSTTIRAVPGDYFEVEVFRGSTTGLPFELDVLGGTFSDSWFAIDFLGT